MHSYSCLAIETRANFQPDGPLDSYTDITFPSIQTEHDIVVFTWKIDITYMTGNYSSCPHFLDCQIFFLHECLQRHMEHLPRLMFSFLSDFDWSITNDFILSASLDCTARVWDPASGQCLRVVNDNHTCGVSACRFQPVNNNMLVVSFQNISSLHSWRDFVCENILFW